MNRLILSVLLVLTIASSAVNGFAVGGMNGGEFVFYISDWYMYR